MQVRRINALFLATMLLACSSLTAQSILYRCNCGEIGTYFNPIYILRQVMGKYRTCWSPLYFQIYSRWNDKTFPDKVEFSTAFHCRLKKHYFSMQLENSKGAFTFDERYFTNGGIEKTSAGLEVSEKKFPYFMANSFFNCQNIPEGQNVNYVNNGPYSYPPMNYEDACFKQTPIDILIDVETPKERSTCKSKSWWYNEFDLLRSTHIFEFCKTPRVLALSVDYGADKTSPGRLSSVLTVTYECEYGVEYTFKIEHRVTNELYPDPICRNNRVDVDPIFGNFTFVKGQTSCRDVYNFFIRKILE